MKKKIILIGLIVLIRVTTAASEIPAVFSEADSLFEAEDYLNAIEEYSKFLDSDNADYALYMIGMSNVNITQFVKYPLLPEQYREQSGDGVEYQRYLAYLDDTYGDKYQTFVDYMGYMKANTDQFWLFAPGAQYVYRCNAFSKIISEYPESEYVDDGAYQILWEDRYDDWEGDYRVREPKLKSCLEFLQQYPESNVRDKVIDMCLGYFDDIIYRGNRRVPEDIKVKYQKERDEFIGEWGRSQME